jgi:hypothetical protein
MSDTTSSAVHDPRRVAAPVRARSRSVTVDIPT